MPGGRKRPSWDVYAITLAQAAKTRSEDPYVQVGAVVFRSDNSVAGVGYNGPPSGVDVDWTDRDARRPRMIHAEANALRYARPGEVDLLAVTMMPCVDCLKMAASYGVRTVVFAEGYENSAVYDDRETRGVAKDFGIQLVLVHIESETP